MRCFFLVMIFLTGFLNAEETPLSARAYNLFSEGKYAEALKIYTDLEKKGVLNADLYYNEGNCYYHLKEYVKAVWYYERCLAMKPGHKDARFNLELAKLRTSRIRMDQSGLDPFEQLRSVFIRFLPLNPLLWITLTILTLISGGGIILLLFREFIFYRHIRKYMGAIFPVLVILIILSGLRIGQNSRIQAVVLEQESAVTSGPGSDFKVLFSLYGGMKVRVLQEEGEWTRIRLRKDFSGWIPRSALGLVP